MSSRSSVVTHLLKGIEGELIEEFQPPRVPYVKGISWVGNIQGTCDLVWAFIIVGSKLLVSAFQPSTKCTTFGNMTVSSPQGQEQQVFLFSQRVWSKGNINRCACGNPQIIGYPQWWSSVISNQRRGHRDPALQSQCLKGSLHMHFCPTICMEDDRSLYIGLNSCTLEHSVPGKVNMGTIPGKYRRDARAPCSKQDLAHAVRLGALWV